jgi:hypothetical protein
MGGEGSQPKEKGERGGQVLEGGKGWRPSRGKRGKRPPLGFSLREKRSDATDDSDFASNGPQPFSHIHAPKINLWQHFFGILHACSGWILGEDPGGDGQGVVMMSSFRVEILGPGRRPRLGRTSPKVQSTPRVLLLPSAVKIRACRIGLSCSVCFLRPPRPKHTLAVL